jgi:hypothetical protein
MKTEAKGPAEAGVASRAPVAAREEAAGGTSFPEVMGQRAGAGAELGSGLGSGSGSAACAGSGSPVAVGGEVLGEGGFVAFASGLVTQMVVASQAFAMRRGGLDPGAPAKGRREDPLDPAARQVAQLAPPMPVHGESAAPRADAAVEARTQASLEEVLPAIVRRIAWSGDGRKGSLRLEFGAGALAGGTLVVHADEGRVKVELCAPEGADAGAWRERIAARLLEKSIRVDEIVVE